MNRQTTLRDVKTTKVVKYVLPRGGSVQIPASDLGRKVRMLMLKPDNTPAAAPARSSSAISRDNHGDTPRCLCRSNRQYPLLHRNRITKSSAT